MGSERAVDLVHFRDLLDEGGEIAWATNSTFNFERTALLAFQPSASVPFLSSCKYGEMGGR